MWGSGLDHMDRVWGSGLDNGVRVWWCGLDHGGQGVGVWIGGIFVVRYVR